MIVLKHDCNCVSDADANAAAADGDITITAASLAETVVLTATGDINLDDVEAAVGFDCWTGISYRRTVSGVLTVSVQVTLLEQLLLNLLPLRVMVQQRSTDGLIELDTVTFTGQQCHICING